MTTRDARHSGVAARRAAKDLAHALADARTRHVARLQRVPRDERDLLAIAVVNHGVPFAVDEVVAVLHRRHGDETARVVDLRDAAFRQPDVPDLSRTLRLLEKSELLRLGDGRLLCMELIRVDAFQPQPPQASVERLAKTLGPAVDLPFVRTWSIEATLGRDDQTCGIRVQRFRNQFFADEWAVGLCGVNQVHAKIHGPPKRGNRLAAVGRRSPDTGTCDPHGAESKAMDRKVTAERKRPAKRGRGYGHGTKSQAPPLLRQFDRENRWLGVCSRPQPTCAEWREWSRHGVTASRPIGSPT